MTAIQDSYPDDLAWCYGCGRLNPAGHHFRTFWENEGTVTRFTPSKDHIAVPGFVSGGILAALVDCHATGTAAWAAYRADGREPGTPPPHRFVTASLRVDYLKPTPLGPELIARGSSTSVSGRKVTVTYTVEVAGVVTVRGEAVCVEIPEPMRPRAP